MITIKHQTAFQTTAMFQAHGNENLWTSMSPLHLQEVKVSREDKVSKRTIT